MCKVNRIRMSEIVMVMIEHPISVTHFALTSQLIIDSQFV
jgi:hypothetical protein